MLAFKLLRTNVRLQVVLKQYCTSAEKLIVTQTGIFKDHDAETSLWFTTLPHKRKNALLQKPKKKFVIPEFIPKGPPIIACKHERFNHFSGQKYEKFETMPLASQGWRNKKSCGDYFTIHPTADHPAFLMTKSDLRNVAGNFDEARIHDWVQKILTRNGIEKLTTIQAKAIPSILAGRNTLLTAETGCGKTFAYLVPMIQRLVKWKDMMKGDRKPNAPLGIIIVPNRELAIQVGEVTKNLCQGTGLKCQTILGGHTKRMIVNPVFQEVDILVATLGVLSKLSTHRQYDVRHCKHLVLDEADTLLDDSFNEKLIVLLNRFQIQYCGPENEDELPNGTQVTLVSATIPTSLKETIGKAVSLESIEKISTKYLHRILPHVPQTFLRVRKSEKAAFVLDMVRRDVNSRIPVMIFCNKSVACDWLSLFLNENGVPCERVHSKMLPDYRFGKYQRFLDGEVNVLSCTDLTSRGIDTTKVKHVINFDFPLYMADYIHRCGRTGRIGHDKDCRITNIISSPREIELVQEIERAARSFSELKNVNNNIAKIIHYRKEKAEEAARAAEAENEDETSSDNNNKPDIEANAAN